MPDATSEKSINIKELRPFVPRQFVENSAVLDTVEAIEPYVEALLSRRFENEEDVERWILDRSEWESVAGQAGTILYIEMTCRTDDPQKEKAYKEYIEKVEPKMQIWSDRLNRRFAEMAQKYPPSQERYSLYQKWIDCDLALFHEESVPLFTEISLLSQEYQKINGAMMVNFRGEEKTLPQMGPYLQDPDRTLRADVWKTVTERRLKDKERMDTILNRQIELRHKVARQAGCDDFCEYQFKAYHRFDYGPQDCLAYHDTVEKYVVPLWQSVMRRRKDQMKLESLRPWDTSVDPLGRPPLKPFQKVQELISGCRRVFGQVDPELGDRFDEMIDLGLLDLDSRKGKAPGGYQSTLSEARKPFIFMNAVGVDQDVRTLLHEGGHAFHSLACAEDPILDYRHAPMEFCEVASMAMELLGGRYLNEFYNEKDGRRSHLTHWEDVIHVLVWVATVDSFQYWLYTHPGHTAETRRQAWVSCLERFGSDVVDWSGLEEVRANSWHRQLHIFEVPFYYIEYGIAQLGALQLYFNAIQNWPDAVTRYKQALSLGGSRPLPELFETAGIRFDFSESTIRPLMEQVRKEMDFG